MSFNKCVVPEPEWIVGTEQLPTEYENLARIDVVVERYNNFSLSVLLIAEKKKGKAGPATITSLESQVLDRSKEYLKASDRDAVWAVTCYGPNFRLWLCRRSHSNLKAIYPTVDRGSREAYLDALENWNDFLQWCDILKQNPEPEESIMDTLTGKGKKLADDTPTWTMQQTGESSGTQYQSSERDLYGGTSFTQPLASLAGMDYQSQGPSYSQMPASYSTADSVWQAEGPSYGQNVAFSCTADEQSTPKAGRVRVSRGKRTWTVTFADGRTKKTEKQDWTKTDHGWAWEYHGRWYYANFVD